MEKGAVFPLFYLPNVEFFKTLKTYKEDDVLIEKLEHYPKQTFRNRAIIACPNGKLMLTVPVKKGDKKRVAYKDKRISNDDNWQHVHWLSLEASYRNSAYFEFYEDVFKPFYHKPYHFLFDFNIELLDVILSALKMPVTYNITSEYEKYGEEIIDFREDFDWRKPSEYVNKPYYQVFEDKIGAQNNLSIVDLLFNQGPQSKSFF
ncbi:WbqC family protein [Pedobacter alpinus]|uniref:WbqC family protein n=1 Tax=Pedobacter alpinus TaxID=1590643 RepID=A0ABW5TXN1_9SPHI